MLVSHEKAKRKRFDSHTATFQFVESNIFFVNENQWAMSRQCFTHTELHITHLQSRQKQQMSSLWYLIINILMIKEANLLLKAHLDQLPMWAESMRELQRKNKI